MEIYLLRHGASVANERMLVCGSADYPLSATGIEQAARVCRQLRRVPFSRIYSSSLSRALDTIAGLAGREAIRIESQLRELDAGEVSHITLPELWARDARFRRPWMSPDLRYPGGETFREMIQRISGWFDTQSQTWAEDEKVLIVGHEGTLRTIYSRLLGLSLADYPDFPIGNCDRLYFELGKGKILRHAHVALASPNGDDA